MKITKLSLTSSLFALILVTGLISGCMQEPIAPIACTKEAKICPDGTGVARNPDLNCEFDPCPESTEPICRTDNYPCTIKQIPCCEGFIEGPMSVEDGAGGCMESNCGTIYLPCGDGICAESENWCNCPEDCEE